MTFLLVLICLKNAFEVPISAGILLVLVCVIALISNKENIVILCACFVPLSTAFQYKYALLMCMIIYIIKYPKDIKLNHYALPLFGMMTWELLHALRYDFVINEYFRNFSEMMFCTFLMLRTDKKVDYFDEAFTNEDAICMMQSEEKLNQQLDKLKIDANQMRITYTIPNAQELWCIIMNTIVEMTHKNNRY